MKREALTELLTGMLVLLFVYAAVSKLIAFNDFKAQLNMAPYTGGHASFIARALPVGELGIALLLTIKNTRKTGLYFFMFLMLLFTGYIMAMLLSGKHLPCSCGGVLQQLSWRQHIVFNLFFMGLCGVAIVLMRKRK